MRVQNIPVALTVLALHASLGTGLSACAAPGLEPVGAARGLLRTQAPAFYRMQLGAFEVTALSDGTVGLPIDQMMNGITPNEVRDLLHAGFETLPLETSM
jgi:hypothetical protein